MSGVAGRRRRVRRWLLATIGALYVASIPWYRGDAPVGRLFGLPDWVGFALLCYALAAVLNSAAWLLTEVPDAPEAPAADEGGGSRGEPT